MVGLAPRRSSRWDMYTKIIWMVLYDPYTSHNVSPREPMNVGDALDECTDRESLLLFLGELIGAQGLCVVATSRREKDIEERFSPIVKHNINIESAVVDKDIYVYTRDRLAVDTRLKKWAPAVQKEILTVITERADGMFRWVYCQLEAIRKCIKLSALRKTLSSLPRTLDETYERIVRNIESSGELQDAITALQWLCFSIRPLDLPEVIEILAIQNGDDGGFLPEERLPDPEDIMVVCSSLIYWDIDDLTEPISNLIAEPSGSFNSSSDDIEQGSIKHVRLAHFSVKEYLLSDRCIVQSSFQLQTCHAMMAESCLRYLLHLYEVGPLTEELVDQYPLARYAAEYWWQHAQKLDCTSGSVLDLALKLLNSSTALLSWVKLYNMQRPWEDPDMTLIISDLAQPLYYAASTGVPEVVESMLHQTIDIDAEVGRYGNALRAASRNGYGKIVRILLNAGANVNAEGPDNDAVGQDNDSALQAAAFHGHEEVVRILLNAGANVNAKRPGNDSALQVAAYRGHEEVVLILLDAGADVNADVGRFGNALEAAALRGFKDVCQILLDAGANFDTRSSALHGADRHLGILKMLLEAGVDVDSRGRNCSTVLQNAVFDGLDTIVQILIDAGADVNASDGQWGSALATASEYGHSEIAKMLLNAGARLEDAEDQSTESVLYMAARNGQKDTVKVLLNVGADVNAQGGHYAYALQAASAYNQETTVRILLDAGANVNAQGGYFGNALQAASSNSVPMIEMSGKPFTRIWVGRPLCTDDSFSISLKSFEATFELRLYTTTNDKGQQSRHGIVLEECRERINKAILELLLDTHADEKLEQVSCGVGLQVTLVAGLESVLETPDRICGLENHRKDIVQSMRYGGGWVSPLDVATGQEWLAQALLDVGANIEIPGGEYGFGYPPSFNYSPISGKASASIVPMLIESGADLNALGGNYGSALQAAARYGHIDIVQILLKHGADINAQGGEYGSALQAACASFEQNEKLVQMLLDAGADINAKGGEYGSALEAASYRGSRKIIRILLDNGADVNAQGGAYGNALQAACASPNAREELVRMLLDAGADCKVQGGKFGNAVQAVLSKGYRAAVLLY